VSQKSSDTEFLKAIKAYLGARMLAPTMTCGASAPSM
jgi:hypothetical protein